MKEKNSSVIASAFRHVVIVLWLFLHVFNHSPTSFVFSVNKLKSLPLFCNFPSFSAVLGPGLHKLWYPGIRDTSTWSKFGAHGEHGDVFLFSNLSALWFSENLIRYSLDVCLREVENTLIYGISRDGSKNFNIRTCEHVILGQLRIWAHTTTYAALHLLACSWPLL